MNKNVEAVRLWTRLADTYLAWGDTVYRRAGDDQAAQAAAAPIYANIVRANGTIPANSPLYRPSQFAAIKQRAQAVAKWLVAKGIPAADIKTISLAGHLPISSGGDGAANRRVDFEVVPR